MARQRYSINEAVNRILRSWKGTVIPSDAPGTLSGEVLSVDAALSDIAELFANSLPNETLELPNSVGNAIVNYLEDGHDIQFGGNNDYLSISASGTLLLGGNATVWNNIRIDGLSSRVGVTAPTSEVGFRGDSNYLSLNFVHTQADEIQFNVQMPHDWKIGSTIYPHAHFSPWITGTATNQAVRFVFEYYRANEQNQIFSVSPVQYLLTDTWAGSKQWCNMEADNDTGISGTGYGTSSLLKCRLYRDNTVANNLAGKVSLLFIEIHYEVDKLGLSEKEE